MFLQQFTIVTNSQTLGSYVIILNQIEIQIERTWHLKYNVSPVPHNCDLSTQINSCISGFKTSLSKSNIIGGHIYEKQKAKVPILCVHWSP